MNSNNRIVATLMILVLAMAVLAAPVYAAGPTGNATIGFSGGGVYYVPYGFSGVYDTLDLNFGEHTINTSDAVQNYTSNLAGFAIRNDNGGKDGYRVTLGLSSFDNGLEGAELTLTSDSGVFSDNAMATDAPVLFGGQSSLQLQADGASTQLVLEASNNSDPSHTARGLWGFAFTGDLMVYTNTIRPGQAKSVMSWDIQIVQ